MNIEIKQLNDNAIIPKFQTVGAAGFDLHACIDEPVELFPGRAFLCPTGFAMHINDPSIAAIIVPRSGLGHKKNIVLGNGTGVIDSDYSGEVFVSLLNRNILMRGNHIIHPGDRIAQMLFIPVMQPGFKLVDDFSAVTERGAGGFGSTGS